MTTRSWKRLGRPELLIALLVVLVAGLVVQPYRAHQASRYALTAAVVERGTVVLDHYEHVLGIDRAVRDGHTYSDKAPGQPFLAVPFFAAAKAVGVEDATVLRIEENLGLWWVTLWTAAVVGAALAVMMYRRARALSLEPALPAVLALFFGSILLPFSALLFGHVLTAALLYGAFLLLVGTAKPTRLAAAGVLAGLAVTAEYTAALGVVVLLVYAIWRNRARAWPYLAGGAVPAFLLGWYNAVAFGSPFTLSYQFTAFSEVSDEARGMLDMFSSASLDNLTRLLFEGRGLLIATPVVIVALAGAVWRLTRGRQVDAVVALSMFGVFLLLPLFWGNPWGGDSPGARYMLPALPFLAVPLVWAWQRWRLLTLAAVMVSCLTMVTATFTEPLISRFTTGGLGVWLSMLGRGELADTVLTMTFGWLGWVVHLAVVTGVAVLLVRSVRGEPLPSSVAANADPAAIEG